MTVDESPRSSTAGGGDPTRGTRRFVLPALFALYLALLAWIVMWKLEVPYFGMGGLRQVKLVPFVSNACNGASAPSEVVANIVLFIPFGLYLGLLAPSWPWWKATFAIAGASLALEVAQYALSVGSSDVTDLITNTAGGLIGLVLLAVVRRRLGERTFTAMTRFCSGLTVLALIATAAFIASPVSFAPQRDVSVSMPGAPGTGPGMRSGEREQMNREARDLQC
ncbi:glycopeptide antibiotics resistance protein [Agromyces cerinus]|uniref:VanZ family protein n=1 Tax=Agromyces cerinus TaxID=33878 RepID=UPI0019585571|nr:VanZ family protein [Agromyces cerinus]MBM7830854.1 glycopeptide antibiotics resistance protein [Agromyces cerinus]